jgi:spore coat-associated protein N
MKNLKKALLGTALAGSLVVGAGFGTYSWFTAETSATGTIDNGTLTLGEMGTLFEHDNFAPSQLLIGEWNKIENTGSLDQVLKATYTHSVDKEANVSKYKVGYLAVKFKETNQPGVDKIKDWKLRIGGILNGTTNPTQSIAKAASDSSDYEVIEGVLSDSEVQGLMKAQEAGGNSKTIELGDGKKFWKLKNNEYIGIIFGVKLSDKAGNEFQGAHYDATFKVEAKQTDDGAMYQSEIDATKK